MRLFKWTAARTVYLPEIDDEHLEIYNVADELHQLILAGADAEAMRASASALAAHAEEHFSHEERLMRAVHYPSFQWHKRQHDTARKAVKRLALQIESNDRAAALELLAFLSGWLKDHTALTDRLMAAYLRNQQRSHAAVS